jgi:flagellar FliJ protein
LLRLREVTRDERRRQLAEAQRAEAVLRERRTQLQTEQQGLKDETAKFSTGRVDVDRVLSIQRYETVLQIEVASNAEQLRQVETEVERRRLILVAADRDVQVLEKLRETQKDRFRIEQERKDLKQMDEIAARVTRPSEVN